MAKRPDMLSEDTFRKSLLQQGCNADYVDAYVSDCRLVVPLLIDEIGEKRFIEIISQRLTETGLKDSYAPQAVRYIVNWAKQGVSEYTAAKKTEQSKGN